VKIHVVPFQRALADGQEFHGADVLQGCDQTAFDFLGRTDNFLGRTDNIVAVKEDAIFESVNPNLTCRASKP
jgi:hypothetical protein